MGVVMGVYDVTVRGAMLLEFVWAAKGEKFQYLNALRLGLLPKLHVESSGPPFLSLVLALLLPPICLSKSFV